MTKWGYLVFDIYIRCRAITSTDAKLISFGSPGTHSKHILRSRLWSWKCNVQICKLRCPSLDVLIAWFTWPCPHNIEMLPCSKIACSFMTFLNHSHAGILTQCHYTVFYVSSRFLLSVIMAGKGQIQVIWFHSRVRIACKKRQTRMFRIFHWWM